MLALTRSKKKEEMNQMLHRREYDRERLYKNKKELAKITLNAEERAMMWNLYRQSKQPNTMDQMWGEPSRCLDEQEKRLRNRTTFYNQLLAIFTGDDKKARMMNNENVRFLLDEMQKYMLNDWDINKKFFFTVVTDVGYHKFELDSGCLMILGKLKESCHITEKEWDLYVEKWTTGRRSVQRFLTRYGVYVPNQKKDKIVEEKVAP
ncbi:hypothetical protein AKO1_008045, partial [Acrasis kona]